MTPDPELSRKEILHRLFVRWQKYNPDEDWMEIDWEAEIAGMIEPGESYESILTTIANDPRWSGYNWGPEFEMGMPPEIQQLREERKKVRELTKLIKESEKIIPAEEIQKIKSELEKQKKIVDERFEGIRKRLERAIPTEEHKELKRTVETVEMTLHETALKLELLRKKWEEEFKRERRVIPADVIPSAPETRICIGEIPTGSRPTGIFDFEGKEIYKITSISCGKEFTIQNPALEDKFLTLALRMGRISTYAAGMIKQLCPECQRLQYGATFWEMVCEDARDGIITRKDIYAARLTPEEFLGVCSKAGIYVTPETIL